MLKQLPRPRTRMEALESGGDPWTLPPDLAPDEGRWVWHEYAGPAVEHPDGSWSRPVTMVGWVRGKVRKWA